MRSTLRTLFVLLLLAGWALAASALHVVLRPDNGIGIVPKNRLGFRETYIDTRAWTPADAQTHPEVLRRLIDTGKTHWLKHVFNSSSNDLTAEVSNLLNSPPIPPTPPPTTKPAVPADKQPRHMGVK